MSASRILSYSVFFLLTLRNGYSQADPQSMRIMFYNVENFFDTFHDSLSEDSEFLPDGVMKWNLNRYYRKLESLYKTITASGDWEPPALVALCEIENRKVLKDLTEKTYLSKSDYNIIHEDSPDRRGIDVCLIYRRSKVRILTSKYWIPDNISYFDTRSVLYAKLLIGQDTVHLVVNHWPSKRGGALNGFDKRYGIVLMIREKLDSISLSHKRNAQIVLMGDFNCTPGEDILKELVKGSGSTDPLINLADSLEDKGYGTYRYKGSWEMIDQVIISVNLRPRIRSMVIFKPDFLMQKDDHYPGLSPFPTYKGFQYKGGYSDHLPVLIDLKVRK